MRPRCLGPNVYPEAPDGGWGWVVAVAFFLVEAFTYGTIKIFGIFLQDLMGEFGETNSRVSWIVSICVFVMTFNGPLSSMMTNCFGFQVVVMAGGLLISLGTIVTSFTSSINQMYLTYGLVAGLGYCLTFLPTVTILSQYFTRRRSLVIAVASTGESLAMFALAPAFSALRDHIGWRHTMAVMGALQSTIIICGALLRPIVLKSRTSQQTEIDGSSPKELQALRTQETSPEASHAPNAAYSLDHELTRSSVSTGDSGVQSLNHAGIKAPDETEEEMMRNADKQRTKEECTPGTEEKPPARKWKLLDFSILKECNFILYCLFGLFATLGFFAPQLYIIELSVSRGVERDSATYMLSTMALSEILGRFFIGWILSRPQFMKKKLLVLLVCVIMMTVDLVGFTLVTEFYGLAACCALYGFFMGTLACTHIPILAEDDVVGIERMSSAAGVYVFIQSFAGLAGPPLGGVLVDLTQNYGSAFYSCAAGMAVSALFLGLVKPAKKGFLCRKRNSEREKYERTAISEEQSGENKQGKNESPLHGSEADVTLDQTGATRDVQEVIRFA